MNLYKNYPVIYEVIYRSNEEETKKTLEFLEWIFTYIKISKNNPNDTILDLGYGTGRLLIPLSKAGYSIEGIEPFEKMSELALLKAHENNINISVSKGSFEELEVKEKYKLKLSINGTMAYLNTSEEFIRAFKNVSKALKTNGYFIVDLMNLLGLIKMYKAPAPEVFTIDDENITFMNYHELDLEKSIWKHKSHIFIEYKDKTINTFVDEHKLAMVTPREIIYYAKLANLECILHLQSYTDRPDNRVSGLRIILVFQKK